MIHVLFGHDEVFVGLVRICKIPHTSADQSRHDDDHQRNDQAAFSLGRLFVNAVLRIGLAIVVGRAALGHARSTADRRRVDRTHGILRGNVRIRDIGISVCQRIGNRVVHRKLLLFIPHSRVKRAGVNRTGFDRVLHIIRQGGKYSGFVVDTGLLNSCAAEGAEFAGDWQLLAAVFAKHE